MRPYHILFKEAEEGGFTGKCLELPGAVSEGETMEELRANMMEAILLIQESIREEAELNHEQITEANI
jgi:predicted RNase H-like HicB family nuclease